MDDPSAGLAGRFTGRPATPAVAAAGRTRTVAFAFDNSRAGTTGLEFVIPFSELGITGGAAESVRAFAFGVSNNAYFSDVTAPGNVTAGNLGFDPDFNANTTSAGCACPNPSAPIGVGPYHAAGTLGAAPNYDLVAFNATSLTVPAGGSIQFRYMIQNRTASPASCTSRKGCG